MGFSLSVSRGDSIEQLASQADHCGVIGVNDSGEGAMVLTPRCGGGLLRLADDELG